MQWPWKKKENELEQEMAHHLETMADGLERQGMSREEALRRAREEFGHESQLKEECRDERRWNGLAQLAQDVRFGWRMMLKTPAITGAAVLSLALGIGATTAMLSVADTLLWKTLPVPAPEQLSELFWTYKSRPESLYKGSSGSNLREGSLFVADFFSPQGFQALRSQAKGKAEVAAHSNGPPISVSYGGTVAVARMRPVSGNFLTMLQVRPHAGRLLTDDDDRASAPLVTVVTHRFWERQLGSDLNAIGKAIRVNNFAYTIAGVLEKGFYGIVPGDTTDLYMTLECQPGALSKDSWLYGKTTDPLRWWLQVMVRRAPGVTAEEVRPLLQTAFASSWEVRPKTPESTPAIRVSDAAHGLGSLRRRYADPVWILLGLVTMVLLVACANIANLLLARAAEREKEVALRMSLGCSQRRLVRQFFTESLMLAGMGGVLSIGVAMLMGTVMLTIMPPGTGGLALSNTPDFRSLAGTAAVALLTAILFGLYPAWRTARVDVGPALKEGSGSGGTVSRRRWLPAKILVLVQVSLGVLLVTSALIFTGHLAEVINRETGFERGNVILFEIRPGELGYEGDRRKQFYMDLERRLEAVPGVELVGLSRTRPMRGGGYWDEIRLPGQEKGVGSALHHASPGFLAALGVPLLSGRNLTPQESVSNTKVAVLSEDAVRRLQLTSPLGAQIHISDATYTVIGVARQSRYAHMTEMPLVTYVPFDYVRSDSAVVIRTSVPPMAALAGVKNAVKEVDPNIPMVDVFTMEEQISRTLQRERLFAWLCGMFGVLALVLCAVGLYGLMSHTTARRTPEIGIRIALGASRGNVLGQVIREGMALAVAGFAIGVPLALYVSSIAQKQRFLPEGELPQWTLAAAIGVLAVSALAAVAGPAMRASAVDPMRALRRG